MARPRRFDCMETDIWNLPRCELKAARHRLRHYPQWVNRHQEMEEWTVAICSPCPGEGPHVTTSANVAIQERVLAFRESNASYQRLTRLIARMEYCLAGLDDDEAILIDLWYFRHRGLGDMLERFNVSRPTFYRWKEIAERKVAWFWDYWPGPLAA